MADASAILATQGLSKSFGGLRAVRDVTLGLSRHELHAVIGPNGAGKSTFVNLLTGQLKPTAGRLFLEGRDITGTPPWEMPRQSADSQFFASGPAPRPSATPVRRPTPARGVTPAASPLRPYRSGAPTRAGVPGEPEPQQPAPVSRASEPVASGGVVALPSIDVLASPTFPRPDPSMTVESRKTSTRVFPCACQTPGRSRPDRKAARGRAPGCRQSRGCDTRLAVSSASRA